MYVKNSNRTTLTPKYVLDPTLEQCRGIPSFVDVKVQKEVVWVIATQSNNSPVLSEATRRNLHLIPSQIQTSQKKKWNLHTKTSKKKDKKIRKLFLRNKLVAASDGSAHQNDRGSYAYCIAKKKGGKILYQAHAPLLVDKEYCSSDRAELLGILHILLYIKDLAIREKVKRKKMKMEVFTDSKSSIDRILNKIHHSTKNAMDDNIDVILEVQELFWNLPIKVQLTHVHSHQDDNVPFNELSMPAQLNTLMDDLADQQYKNPITEHDILMPHLDAQKISFRTKERRLTKNTQLELIRIRRDFPGEAAALKSWGIQNKHKKLIHWDALGIVMEKKGKYTIGGYVKCLHRLWDTTARKKEWKQAKYGTCPLCQNEIETCDHIYKCEHSLIKKSRDTHLKECFTKIKKIGTAEKLTRRFEIIMNQWTKNFPVQIPPKIRGGRKIRKAMKDQKKVGWNNFVRGILSKKWGEIQLKHSIRKRKMKGTIGQVDRWSEEVIQALLTFSTNMWKTRCELIHLLGKGTEDDTTRTQIHNRWFRLKKEPWMPTPMDRHLLSKNEEFFRRARITNVRAWNERVKIALKWSEGSANFLGEDLCRYYPTVKRRETKGKRNDPEK